MTERMFGRICLIQFTVLSEASSKERSVFDHKVCVEVDGMACLSDRLFSSREDDWTIVTEGWFISGVWVSSGVILLDGSWDQR